MCKFYASILTDTLTIGPINTKESKTFKLSGIPKDLLSKLSITPKTFMAARILEFPEGSSLYSWYKSK